MSLGIRINELIDKHGFKNLAEAGIRIGIDQGSLSRIIRDSQDVSASRLLKIAQFFNVSTDYLLTGKELGKGEYNQNITQNISGSHLNTNQNNVVLGPGASHRYITVGDSGKGHDSVSVINEKLAKLSPEHQKTIIELVEFYSESESRSKKKL